MEKKCRNCKWLLKIHEETTNLNRYHCIFPLTPIDAKNNAKLSHPEKKDCTPLQTDFTKILRVSLNTTCKYFEVRPKTTSYFRTVDIDFYTEYLKFFDRDSAGADSIGALREKINSLELAIDTIRNVVGIKIPEIDIKVSNMDIKQVKKIIKSRDWYKNQYSNLNEKYQNILKLTKKIEVK